MAGNELLAHYEYIAQQSVDTVIMMVTDFQQSARFTYCSERNVNVNFDKVKPAN